jgi:Protein of unknown function (DUF3037)
MPGAGHSPFSYAVLRVVPRIERGERFNVGVVLYCRQRSFLGARTHLDERPLGALAPDVSADELRGHLEALVKVAAGEDGSGPIGVLPQSERFGWLVAPSSTMIQPSEVHTGLCDDPAATLDQLFKELVERAS